MHKRAISFADSIFHAATPVLRIFGLTPKYWKRNTANGPRGNRDPRIGPWMRGEYTMLNEALWKERGACLYLVKANDAIQYVGISRNRLKDRWRLSPAYDAQTMQPLPTKQLFHSQCWRRIEAAAKLNPHFIVEVRAIKGKAMRDVLHELGEPLSAFTVFTDDESLVASVERWLCNHSGENLAGWNIAMTGKTAQRESSVA